MRFITDCVSCGPVVVPAAEFSLLRDPRGDFEGMFACPVCVSVRTMQVGRAVAPALVARGALVTPLRNKADGALTSADVAQFRALLADDGACRRRFEEAL